EPNVSRRANEYMCRMRAHDANKHSEQQMRRGLFVGAALAVALACMGTARARNFDLLFRGTFSVTATQTCLLSIGGFNADLTPNAFSFVTSTTSVGTSVLNGDGTGS